MYKSVREPFFIYTRIESLITKIGGCKNNPEKSPTNKSRRTFSMSTTCVFDDVMHLKYNVNKSKDCMKKFCESLKDHVIKITKFERN